MALQTSGPISLSDIANQFGDATPYSISEFYRNGGLVPESSLNANIPTRGQISFSNFYGATNSWTTSYTTSWTTSYTVPAGPIEGPYFNWYSSPYYFVEQIVYFGYNTWYYFWNDVQIASGSPYNSLPASVTSGGYTYYYGSLAVSESNEYILLLGYQILRYSLPYISSQTTSQITSRTTA